MVAACAVADVIEAGGQAALMAPTELLARQHHHSLAEMFTPLGLDTALLTGRDKGKARERVLGRLASGTTPVAVGTHALIQADVTFRDLRLAVIDEQHRFGVDQRLGLTDKGSATDVLAMTATPIPRSLQMALYGDMDASAIWGMPPGRVPVDTRVITRDRLDEVVAGLGRKLDAGTQAFWVCPAVEDSEETPELTDASSRHRVLAEVYGADRCGLIHGQLKPRDKDAVMERFVAGGIGLLVATTVIEVGVNVPAATVMVVEHAERFGLAQLHQLRGRVGRGDAPGTCLLIYAPPLGAVAADRLKALRDSHDGFEIAERDLGLRGGGDVLGKRQSGLPDGRLCDLAQAGDLIALAQTDARAVLATRPELTGDRGAALRVLLYLFERDAAVRYLRSG